MGAGKKKKRSDKGGERRVYLIGVGAALAVGASPEEMGFKAYKLARMAAEEFGVPLEQIELAAGAARVKGDPGRTVAVGRLAARAHWNPVGMPEGVTPGVYESVSLDAPVLGNPDDADRIASAMTYGFVADLAAVELDRATGRVEIAKYVSVHDVGTMLNPRIVEGQIQGGFAHGLGAALFEELVHDRAGNFVSGSFAEYLCPTAPEMPALEIGHVSTPTPVNLTGAKGMGDGSSMLAPAALANAAADALGREDIELPLTLQRVWELANGREPTRSGTYAAPRRAAHDAAGGSGLQGEGEATLSMPPQETWTRMLDEQVLAAAIPGCRGMTRTGPESYEAEVALGVAGVRGEYRAALRIVEERRGQALRIEFRVHGKLGHGRGTAWVEAEPRGKGTRLRYRYAADVGGTVAAVGNRMLGAATRVLIGQFFKAFDARATWRARGGLRATVGRWLARDGEGEKR